MEVQQTEIQVNRIAIACLALILGGCASVHPLVEVSHTSHVSQHYGPNQTNYGWNVVSVGVRWRPVKGVQVDVLDGYTPQLVDYRHEVFTARVQWEIGAH